MEILPFQCLWHAATATNVTLTVVVVATVL